MHTLATDLTEVLQHLLRLVEAEDLSLRVAADRVQATYHRYTQYRLRCIATAGRTTMRFSAWLQVDAEYQAAAAEFHEGKGDLVRLAQLQRQLAYDAGERGGINGRS